VVHRRFGQSNYAVKALTLKDSGPIQSFVLFVALMCVLVNLVCTENLIRVDDVVESLKLAK
jgi:ABC-type dipeptide/oligopeptide/nickel transport system permease component